MSEDELLDAEITGLLSGRGRPDADPTLTWLAAAARTTPPPELRSRVDAALRRTRQRAERPSRELALVAWALAAVFALKAAGSLVGVGWVQEQIGGHAGSGRSTEAALALVAAAACAVAGGLRRAWTPVAVACTAPLALALCLHGVSEVGTVAAGAVLHMTEGVLGLLLLVAWWHDGWRGRRADPERSRRTGA